MLLDQINMNYLRIFEAVYRTKSMTQAATELHLTQSGISQHIKSLEDTLKVKLFDRIKQKLIPTEDGKKLYQQLAPHLQRLEEILIQLTNKENTILGDVTIGLPVVFGLNVVLPHLSKWGSQNHSLNFRIFFELAQTLNRLLLKGDVDFAFIDEVSMDRQIDVEFIYDETLFLCCSKKFIEANGEGTSKKYFESLEYIAYESEATMIRKWLTHHHKINNAELKIRAELGDALGVAKLITSHLGAGVLPGHQLEKLKADGHNLYTFPSKNQKELKNRIGIASVKGRSWSPAVQETYNYLLKEIKAPAKNG